MEGMHVDLQQQNKDDDYEDQHEEKEELEGG